MSDQELRQRAANMLDAYVESIRASGDYARWHYIPEVEQIAKDLREGRQEPTIPIAGLRFEVVINRNISAGVVRFYQEGQLVGEIRNIKEPS